MVLLCHSPVAPDASHDPQPPPPTPLSRVSETYSPSSVAGGSMAPLGEEVPARPPILTTRKGIAPAGLAQLP